jgi:hypothetical protein
MGSAYKRNSNAWVTRHRIFGEYLRAACAMGLPVRSGVRGATEAHLLWYCNPGNPNGEIRGGAIALVLKRLARGVSPAGDAGPSAGRGARLHHRSLPGDE